jgi:hypothetical protein
MTTRGAIAEGLVIPTMIRQANIATAVIASKGNMRQEMIALIDNALDQFSDRSYVTRREFSDILLDMRLVLMKEEAIGFIPLEDDALAGIDNLSADRFALSTANG